MLRTCLTLVFFLALGIAAPAQEIAGRWLVAFEPGGAPVIELELAEAGDRITGEGSATEALFGVPLDIVVTDGRAATLGLFLSLEFRTGPVGPAVGTAQLLVDSGPGDEQTGRLLGDFGSRDIWFGRPRRDPACVRMDALMADINAVADTETVQEVRGILTLAGLAFGGEETGEKCGVAVTMLEAVQATLPELPPPPPAERPDVCVALDTLRGNLASIGDPALDAEVEAVIVAAGLSTGLAETEEKCWAAYAELTIIAEELSGPAVIPDICYDVRDLADGIAQALRRRGVEESGTLDAILAEAGLPVADLKPGGRETEETCGRALPRLEAYLDDLLTAPLDPARREDPPTTFATGGWGPAAGGERVTLWDHNGSAMAYESGPGDRRVIWYWDPRPALADVGVRRGTLLFDGAKTGPAEVAGEARIFTRACGAYAYPVRGPVTEGPLTVTLRGERPLVNAACEITGTRPDTLVFTFEATSPFAAEAPAQPEENDAPGFGVWAETYRVWNVPPGDTLNVRAGPSTRFDVVGELPRDARDILITGEGCTPDLDQRRFGGLSRDAQAAMLSRRWCRVSWRGLEGWAYGRYLRPM